MDNRFEVVEADYTHVESIVEVWKELMVLHRDLDEESFGTSEDAPEIVAEFVERSMDSDEFLVAVALSGGDVAGYSLSRIVSQPPVFRLMPRGEITDIVVREKFRRGGIGDALVSKAVDWFESMGIKRIEMMVAERNEDGRAFWEAQGFVPFLRRMYLDRK